MWYLFRIESYDDPRNPPFKWVSCFDGKKFVRPPIMKMYERRKGKKGNVQTERGEGAN